MAGTETQRPTPRGLLTPAQSRFRRPSVTDWSAPHLNLRSRNNGQKEPAAASRRMGCSQCEHGLPEAWRSPPGARALCSSWQTGPPTKEMPHQSRLGRGQQRRAAQQGAGGGFRRPVSEAHATAARALRSSECTVLSPARAQCARPAGSPLVTKSQHSTVIKHRSEDWIRNEWNSTLPKNA